MLLMVSTKYDARFFDHTVSGFSTQLEQTRVLPSLATALQKRPTSQDAKGADTSGHCLSSPRTAVRGTEQRPVAATATAATPSRCCSVLEKVLDTQSSELWPLPQAMLLVTTACDDNTRGESCATAFLRLLRPG